MSEPLPSSGASRPRGWPLLAWLVIGAMVGLILYRGQTNRGGWKTRFDVVLFEVQARNLVGSTHLLGAKGPELYKQIQMLNCGSYGQRLRFAILAGELVGPAAALERLQTLQQLWTEHNRQPPGTEAYLRHLLECLYQNQPLSPDQKEEALRRGLGWFGKLALASRPEDNADREAALAPARRSALVLMSMGALALLLVVVGLIVLVVLFSMWVTGRLQGGLETGTAPGGIYAETFALWMLVYLGLSLGLSWMGEHLGAPLMALLLMLLSLGVLGWPVLRGVPWRQVRQDVGLTLGPRPERDLLAGLGTYLAALPVLLVWIIVMGLVLTWRRAGQAEDPFGPSPNPGHPILEQLLHGSLWGRLQWLLLAAVMAPVMEETVFRGLLYRHLREATGRMGRTGSVVVSMLVVSFVFAIIHPQGLLAVPLLMTLACAFTLAREWRGSLLPSMFCHGLNNGVAVSFMLMMGG